MRSSSTSIRTVPRAKSFMVGSDWWGNVHEAVVSSTQLIKHIALSAWEGQTLSRMTVFLIAHSITHILFCGSFWVPRGSCLAFNQRTSAAIICFNAFVNACGYMLLIALYRHSVSTIFNRTVPTTWCQCIPSLGTHMALLKPLQICWRYATARFRVLPDIIVLGEARCGTTTLCQHLSSLPGCHEPFCLWKHPELDKKESFYFVGHYLGMVDPFYYRMCFPLSLTKWFYQSVLGKPFFSFDGCAQYLTSPTAPYLIAQAYRDAGQPPPVLVACVRDPVDQAISWWRYENNAMQWGSSMGLSTWNEKLRSTSYPPSTMSNAIDFSLSAEVDNSYRRAEELVQKMVKKPSSQFILPPWAMTWPSGQLSSIGRNGCYSGNIRRYENVFSESFVSCRGNKDNNRNAEMVPFESKLRYVNVVPLEWLGDRSALIKALAMIVKQIFQRQSRNPQNDMDKLVETFCCSSGVHRNASISLTDLDLEPTNEDEERLARIFSQDTRDLEGLCGVKLGWMTSF